MSASPFFVSKFVVRNLKQVAVQSLPQISSSHVSEGIAAALGFKSYAALRSALSEHATALAQRPSNASMVHRLKQLGHVNRPDNLKVLLDLDRSYSPFKTYSLRRKRGIRWTAWRNVVVSAINAGLEQRVFGLLPGENWWPGAPRGAEVGLHTTFPFVFDRDIPGAVSVKGSTGGTLFINVVLNPRIDNGNSGHDVDLPEGDVHAHCWLERRLGVWIQDGGEGFSCRRALLARIAGVSIDPHGYGDFGSFIL